MHGRDGNASISEKILVDWRRMSGVGRHLLACSNSYSHLPACYGGVNCIFWCQFLIAEGGACAALQLLRSQSINVVWGVSMGFGQLRRPETHVRNSRASFMFSLSLRLRPLFQ